MSDFLYTILWFAVYSIPSFIIQLFLCSKVKNRYIKNIPLYLTIAAVVFVLDMFFNFTGLHSGWHELGAFFVGVYVAIFASGVGFAFLVHKIYTIRKNRNR